MVGGVKLRPSSAFSPRTTASGPADQEQGAATNPIVVAVTNCHRVMTYLPSTNQPFSGLFYQESRGKRRKFLPITCPAVAGSAIRYNLSRRPGPRWRLEKRPSLLPGQRTPEQ